MKLNDIQDGCIFYYPNLFKNEVQQLIVENFGEDKDNPKLFKCWLCSEEEKVRVFVKQWEEVDSRKSPDQVQCFVPYTKEFGFGGCLTFYFNESGAERALRELRK